MDIFSEKVTLVGEKFSVPQTRRQVSATGF